MESCGNYHLQIRKAAGVADGSLDSLLVNDRGIGVGRTKTKEERYPPFWCGRG